MVKDQEQAEAGLSRRAARVLSRLRSPERDDGCVPRVKLGISTSGSDVKAVMQGLTDAGFTVTSGHRGYRLVCWGLDDPSVVLPGGRVRCGEKPAEPLPSKPVTLKSSVFGSGTKPAGGPTEPPAAREDDTTAPSLPDQPSQVHGTVPFAGKPMDWELWAIDHCISHIECLPEAARARVACYVASRYL